MRKKAKISKKKTIIGIGAACLFFLLGSIWYAVVFNESRLVIPTDFSEYVFCIKDLPMICSVLLTCLYLFFLIGLLLRAIIENKRKESTAQVTRKISPGFGFFGFFGFAGFLGFWTWSIDQTIYPFVFFLFFGFFGFFYEGKMSGTFMDERYRENKIRAHAVANKTALSIIFIATILLGQGKLMGNLEYTLIAYVIIVTLSLALEVFLSEYLLYRYDHTGYAQEESEE